MEGFRVQIVQNVSYRVSGSAGDFRSGQSQLFQMPDWLALLMEHGSGGSAGLRNPAPLGDGLVV